MTNQKPVTKEWLHQKYVAEGLGTVQIGRLVNRHPKRVYEWLRDFGIPTRAKWQGNKPKKGIHLNPDWLKEEYINKGRTLGDMGNEAGVTPNTILKYMRKFGVETRTTVESRAINGTLTSLSGKQNPMYHRRGEKNPNWRGGCTPDRQALYNSQEWADVVQLVWKRDNATCQRCNKRKNSEVQIYHVHHIVSFAVVELRTDPDNLTLVCEDCHTWIHSKKNKQKEFIKEITP